MIATLMCDIASSDASYNSTVLYPSLCLTDFEKVRCHLTQEITKSSCKREFAHDGALLLGWHNLLGQEATSPCFVAIDDDDAEEEISASDAAADAECVEEEVPAILHPVSKHVILN